MNVHGLMQAVFHHNLEALSMTAGGRRMVAETVQVGRTCRAMGTPVLRLGAHVLDAPELNWHCPLDGDTATLLFGLGCGNRLRQLRAAGAEPIVYEPEPGIARTLLHDGPAELDGWSLALDMDQLCELWGTVAGECDKALVIYTPGYRELFPEEVSAAHEVARAMVFQKRGVRAA